MGKDTGIQWPDRTLPVPRRGCEAYRVDDTGNVWTCWARGGRPRRLTTEWRVKVPFVAKKGHVRVELRTTDGRVVKAMVHVLVLESFVGPCPPGMEGCHEDGDPANNRPSNLRWDTPQGNWRDRKRHGRGCEGVKSPQAKLTDDAVRGIREARASGVKLKDLARRYGVSMTKISHVATGKSWNHVNG